MKTCKNLFLLFIILAGSFVVAAAEEDEYGMAEVIGDLIAFIIGHMVGACLSDTQCAAVLVPTMLVILLGMLIIAVILSCCGYEPIDNDYHYDFPSKRRTAIFAAGVGFGAYNK